MKFILLIVSSLTLQPGVPGVATAEFDDVAACREAQKKIAEEFIVRQRVPGATMSTMCLPKATEPRK